MEESLGETPKIIKKPLPQILDEMEDNIVAAAKAARKYEEALTKLRQSFSPGAGKYLIVFEKAGHNYSAYSPDVQGCIATGKTRAEAEKNIREAISFHLEGLKADGLPLPKPTSSAEYVEV